MSELTDLLNRELETTRQALVAQYDALGLRASGKYEKSLEVFVQDEVNKIRAGIKGAKHVIYMEQGRGPNKRKDRGMIGFIYRILLEWMKVKGITDINPWMAARKIVLEGIKVPNPYNRGGVVSNVVNEEWVNDLQAKILELQNATYMKTVLSELQTLKV